MARTVLFIDYNPQSIGTIRPVLQTMGLHVVLARDGLTGIDMFHALNPDMVLLQDLVPLKHGFEVCREIKNTEEGKTTPVVLLASLTNGRRREVPGTGCDVCLEKPVQEQSLIELIQKIFPGHDSMQSVTERNARLSSSRWQQIPFEVEEEDIDRKLDEVISWDQPGESGETIGEPETAAMDVQVNKNELPMDLPSSPEKKKNSGRPSTKSARPEKPKTTKKKTTKKKVAKKKTAKKKVARKSTKKKAVGSTTRKKTARKKKSAATSKSQRAKKVTPSRSSSKQGGETATL